jgi:hypothetical protein
MNDIHFPAFAHLHPRPKLLRLPDEDTWSDWPPRALDGVDQRPWVNAVLEVCRDEYARRRKASAWRAGR